MRLGRLGFRETAGGAGAGERVKSHSLSKGEQGAPQRGHRGRVAVGRRAPVLGRHGRDAGAVLLAVV